MLLNDVVDVYICTINYGGSEFFDDCQSFGMLTYAVDAFEAELFQQRTAKRAKRAVTLF